MPKRIKQKETKEVKNEMVTERIWRVPMVLPTVFPLQSGKIYEFYALPKNYKSTFINNICYYLHREGAKIGLIDTENSNTLEYLKQFYVPNSSIYSSDAAEIAKFISNTDLDVYVIDSITNIYYEDEIAGRARASSLILNQINKKISSGRKSLFLISCQVRTKIGPGFMGVKMDSTAPLQLMHMAHFRAKLKEVNSLFPIRDKDIAMLEIEWVKQKLSVIMGDEGKIQSYIFTKAEKEEKCRILNALLIHYYNKELKIQGEEYEFLDKKYKSFSDLVADYVKSKKGKIELEENEENKTEENTGEENTKKEEIVQ